MLAKKKGLFVRVAVIMAACAAVVLLGPVSGCDSGKKGEKEHSAKTRPKQAVAHGKKVDAEGRAEAHFDRGVTHFEKGEYDAAVAACKKAIAIKPDYANAYHNRAVAHYSRRDYSAAWADVKTCRKLGGKVAPELLAELRKASGREE